ncbi:MAG: response regulator transcription factor [Amphiplicatus sp.]
MAGNSVVRGPRAEAAPFIHVIDDDQSLRTALDSLFRSVGHIVRTYSSAQEFVSSFEDAPGCLVLDVRLPGISGLDFQSQLESLGVRIPVILMTGHGDIPMSVRGMKAGAVDFLPKPFRDQDMLDAVAVALERDRVSREARRESDELQSRFQSLSQREQQVMALVSTGLMNKQIAFELGLSEITIKIHRGHAMKKMGAKTLADLVKMAESLGVSAGKMEGR